jgi:hypothetical protein
MLRTSTAVKLVHSFGHEHVDCRIDSLAIIILQKCVVGFTSDRYPLPLIKHVQSVADEAARRRLGGC